MANSELFKVNIRGVDFMISAAKTTQESPPEVKDRIWLAVHPVKLRPQPQETLDYEEGPVGVLPPRTGVVGVAQGTDPEGALTEPQAETARLLAQHLVEHFETESRFTGKHSNKIALLHEPGSKNANEFDDSQSTTAWISVPRLLTSKLPSRSEMILPFMKMDNLAREELKKEVGRHLFEVAKKPDLFLGLPLEAAQQPADGITFAGKETTRRSSPAGAAGSLDINAEFEAIMDMVTKNAPDCPDKEKFALIAALVEHFVQRLGQGREAANETGSPGG